MPCEDCERAIAELRAEFDALEQQHKLRQQVMFDAMNKVLDSLEAKNEALLASIDREVRDIFARIKALAPSTEKAEPPTWQ